MPSKVKVSYLVFYGIGILCCPSGEYKSHYDPDNDCNKKFNAQDLEEHFKFIPAYKKVDSHYENDACEEDKRSSGFR